MKSWLIWDYVTSMKKNTQPEPKATPRPRRRRDPEATRAAILQAALEEFSEMGHFGARVDRIAERAGASKPMIYDYFGDKDAVYRAALREAYVQIREAETELDLAMFDPEESIRRLVVFTLQHFLNNPWFIRILNTENMMGGEAIKMLKEAPDIQSPLLLQLQKILDRGAEEGIFKTNIVAVDFYVLLASLCYFPVSNKHTLKSVFNLSMDEAWMEAHARTVGDMLVKHLQV